MSARQASRRRSRASPLGFKPRVTGDDVIASYTDHVLRVVAHLIALESKTGRTVQLALEPEPYCFLETTDETIAYFSKHLYSGAAVEKLAKLAHVPIAEANEALRRHLGIVYDICHQAVEYEDITQSLQKLVDGGVPIFKLQEAAALHVPEVTQDVVDTLKRYAKTIYLTQTMEKQRRQAQPLPQCRRRHRGVRERSGRQREWRTHIHVPVFLDDLGQFRTTRFAIEDGCASTSKSRCRAISRSRPTLGTCCPTTSRRATSSTMFAASSNGCAGNWSRVAV